VLYDPEVAPVAPDTMAVRSETEDNADAYASELRRLNSVTESFENQKMWEPKSLTVYAGIRLYVGGDTTVNPNMLGVVKIAGNGREMSCITV